MFVFHICWFLFFLPILFNLVCFLHLSAQNFRGQLRRGLNVKIRNVLWDLFPMLLTPHSFIPPKFALFLLNTLCPRHLNAFLTEELPPSLCDLGSIHPRGTCPPTQPVSIHHMSSVHLSLKYQLNSYILFRHWASFDSGILISILWFKTGKQNILVKNAMEYLFLAKCPHQCVTSACHFDD